MVTGWSVIFLWCSTEPTAAPAAWCLDDTNIEQEERAIIETVPIANNNFFMSVFLIVYTHALKICAKRFGYPYLCSLIDAQNVSEKIVAGINFIING